MGRSLGCRLDIVGIVVGVMEGGIVVLEVESGVVVAGVDSHVVSVVVVVVDGEVAGIEAVV